MSFLLNSALKLLGKSGRYGVHSTEQVLRNGLRQSLFVAFYSDRKGPCGDRRFPPRAGFRTSDDLHVPAVPVSGEEFVGLLFCRGTVRKNARRSTREDSRWTWRRYPMSHGCFRRLCASRTAREAARGQRRTSEPAKQDITRVFDGERRSIHVSRQIRAVMRRETAKLVAIEPAILRTPVYATDFGRYRFKPRADERVIFPYAVSSEGLPGT